MHPIFHHAYASLVQLRTPLLSSLPAGQLATLELCLCLHTSPMLPAAPASQVATSDGVLRAYTFGNMASAASVVAAPRPLPPPPPVLPRAAAPAAAAPAAAADLEGKAAATALPSDGEEDDWEQVGRGGCN